MSNQIYRILSFDPGLSTAGWNLSECNPDDQIMIIRKYGMLYPNKEVETAEHKAENTKYGTRIMTLDALRTQVRDLFNTYHPDFVVSEDAFFNPTRPIAYCALVQWLTTISLVLFDEYQQTLFRLAPKIVKQISSGDGTSDKNDIQDAILHRSDIEFDPPVVKEELTEHICDSIGIGYTFIQEVLPSLLTIRSLFD